MEKFKKHFLMTKEDVKEYLKKVVKYFDENEELEVYEIGDGNINYVFRAISKKTNKSIVVKQADKYLRSSGRELDVYRNKIEAEILKIEYELEPNFVPKIYFYDENMYAVSMEDISDYINLRKELSLRKKFLKLSDDITTFIVNTTFPLTDLVLDRHEKKKNVIKFTNIELCDITEDLVLTEPYYNYKNRNIITSGNEEFVKNKLYNDEILKSEVCKLRNNFMNNSQTLIHGDLHSGSIFINQNGLKVIDPEFAFYGPMGYDIGNVIGNLFFALYNSKYTDKNDDFILYISNTISEIYDKMKEKLLKKYDELVKFELYKNDEFKKYYINKIMEDSLGYAGLEMIRRTVGDAKVLEITSVLDLDNKLKMEQDIINKGIYLIKNRKNICCGSDVVNE